MPPTTIDEIRDDVKVIAETIPNLGGDDATVSNRKIHKFLFESDDPVEAKAYWTSSIGGESIINGLMMTRERRGNDEPFASGAVREFVRLHDMKLVFRYGRKEDAPETPVVEGEFETILEAFLDALEGSGVFDRDGLTPQTEGKQAADADIVNKKLYGLRVWEATIRFTVVVRIFKEPSL